MVHVHKERVREADGRKRRDCWLAGAMQIAASAADKLFAYIHTHAYLCLSCGGALAAKIQMSITHLWRLDRRRFNWQFTARFSLAQPMQAPLRAQHSPRSTTLSIDVLIITKFKRKYVIKNSMRYYLWATAEILNCNRATHFFQLRTCDACTFAIRCLLNRKRIERFTNEVAKYGRCAFCKFKNWPIKSFVDIIHNIKHR